MLNWSVSVDLYIQFSPRSIFKFVQIRGEKVGGGWEISTKVANRIELSKLGDILKLANNHCKLLL